MYRVYLDKLLLPITPGKIDMKINNQNKRITLINDGEINVIKQPGLTDISFDMMLPQTKYPFATYKRVFGSASAFTPASDFLDALEELKTSCEPFSFIISRSSPNGIPLFDTNMDVTLEEYKIVEDAKNGCDLMVSVKLKQYRNYSTKKYKVKKEKKQVLIDKIKTRSTKNSPAPKTKAKTYTVKKGDCLWNIAKQFYGNGSQYTKIFNANKDKVKNPNKLTIGIVLTIPSVKE